jgi:conjugal transfer/entry exclusion protein
MGTGDPSAPISRSPRTPLAIAGVALLVGLVALVRGELGGGAALTARVQALEAQAPTVAERMTAIQHHLNALSARARAERWEEASYSLARLEALMAAVPALAPDMGGIDTRQWVRAFEVGPVAQLREGIAMKDQRVLDAAFDGAIASCNACHANAGFKQLVVTRP